MSLTYSGNSASYPWLNFSFVTWWRPRLCGWLSVWLDWFLADCTACACTHCGICG